MIDINRVSSNRDIKRLHVPGHGISEEPRLPSQLSALPDIRKVSTDPNLIKLSSQINESKEITDNKPGLNSDEKKLSKVIIDKLMSCVPK